MDTGMAKRNRVITNKILEERYGENWRTLIGKKGGYASSVVCKEKGVGFFDSSVREIGRKCAKLPKAIEKRKETFQTIKHQQGNKNSQFGTMWITDGHLNRKIKKDEIIPEGWRMGRVC